MCVINDTQKNKCTNRSASKLQHMQYVGKSGFQIQYCHVYPRNLKALNGLREALIREKKIFFVKSLHKMMTPPSLFIFFRPFFERKKEMILKGVDGCFKGV